MTAGELWSRVDEYLERTLSTSDELLAAALEDGLRAGLPQIQVSPLQGKLLNLLARMAGARRILEIGTLAGYSTIWLARALPAGGRLISLEASPRHAAVAMANLKRAGLDGIAEVRVGLALDSLAQLQGGEHDPFDFVFIDADKAHNAEYVEAVLPLSRPGTVIVVDNVVRGGGIVDPETQDEAVKGTCRMFDTIAAEKRLSATVVQTVGVKGYDGFALMLVEEGAS